jgi:predicted ATPase/class 3 adenylate cyclase
LASRIDLPTGTITFLRSDVEGSMRLARALGGAWDDLNASQIAIIREAVESHAGVCVRTEGDAVFAVFSDALGAMHAAIDTQRRIATHDWPSDNPVRVRIGLHTGEAHLAGDDYGGFDVNRAARIAAVGHGGQIVLSDPTRALCEPDLPPGVAIRDLGRHALKDVPQPERLFQLDVPGLPVDFPPIRTSAAASGKLPPRLTSFVARDVELGELAALVETSRLVTITGPGGIGKTSLSVELARGHAEAFPDGAWFVPLDVVPEPDLVPAAIARALNIYDGPGSPMVERLERNLVDRQMLLLLDNFEHLLDAAPLVADLLRAAPGLRIIVTSRAPLHLGGEQEYPLGTLAPKRLAAPATEHMTGEFGGRADAVEGLSPAARLFVERASAVRPGWSPADDGRVIEAIARLVDGLPLGIELAAARMAVLPPEAIRDRLAARLPLPGSGPRDVPGRQRTLEATIAWSYELLTPDRRRFLNALAVFEGSFDIEQVATVGSLAGGEDPLDALFELADQSLIARSAVSGHQSGLGGVRFEMLETIRAFALGRLAAEGIEHDTRRRHALAMLGLAEEAAKHLPGADQARWLDRLSEDHDNLAAALRWTIDAGEVELAQRLSWATWRYWQFGGHLRLGRSLADAAIDMPGADEPSPGRMWSFAAAGGMAYWQADTSRAAELYRAQLETALQIGDRAGEADANFNLSATETILGERSDGWAFLSRARDVYREIGDEIGLARTEWGRANMMAFDGRMEEGLEVMLAVRERYRETGDAMYEALAEGALAYASLTLGELPDALRHAIKAIQLSYALRDIATTTISLADGAIALVEVGRNHEAAICLAAYNHLCDVLGVQPPAGLGALILRSRVEERAFQNLSSDEHADAIKRGQAMTLDDAVAFFVEELEKLLREVPPEGTKTN